MVVDMSSMMTSEVCKRISTICLQEVALLSDCPIGSAFMLACLSTHTEVPMNMILLFGEKLGLNLWICIKLRK